MSEKPMTPMGAAALLWAWLQFRIRLDRDAVSNAAIAISELLQAVNQRADIMGWLDEEDPPDTDRNS